MLISMLYYITVLRYSTPVAEIRMRIYAITTKQITLTLVGCILVTFSVPFLFDMFIIILGSII